MAQPSAGRGDYGSETIDKEKRELLTIELVGILNDCLLTCWSKYILLIIHLNQRDACVLSLGG